MKLNWRVVPHADGTTCVRFSGGLTEQAALMDLLREPLKGRLVLDLGDLEWINSYGVREWIRLVNALGSRGFEIEYHRCSHAFVRHMNMVSQFRGPARVRSVLLPYFCATCRAEQQLLIGLSDAGAPPLVEPSQRCLRCGGEAEFDDLVEDYFAFLDPSP
jgi:anti-anti-sigma regulatory factor